MLHVRGGPFVYLDANAAGLGEMQVIPTLPKLEQLFIRMLKIESHLLYWTKPRLPSKPPGLFLRVFHINTRESFDMAQPRGQ
jgi:hypothetical protein